MQRLLEFGKLTNTSAARYGLLSIFFRLKSSMSLSLDDSQSCLRHARRRIAELEDDVNKYISTSPYIEIKDTDPATGDTVRKLRVTLKPPRELGHVVFDAVSHMRAALDQAAHAAAVAGGSRGEKAYFPFGGSEEDARAKKSSGSKDVPTQVFEIMISFQPYKTGNLYLWALNKLCNTMKHAIMVYPELKLSGVTVHRGSISGGNVGNVWNPETMEIELERIRPGGSSSLDISYKFQVRLGDESPVAGLPPAVEYLNGVADLVEQILTVIESMHIQA